MITNKVPLPTLHTLLLRPLCLSGLCISKDATYMSASVFMTESVTLAVGRHRSLSSAHAAIVIRLLYVMALDYIWNELESRIGRLICDPDLEAGKYKFLTWILVWRSKAQWP